MLSMLAQVALRNVLASKINLLIGGLILLGTFCFVVFGALLDTLSESMSKSVVGSVAGHVQIYSAKSKDEVSLYRQLIRQRRRTWAAVTQFPKIQAVARGAAQREDGGADGRLGRADHVGQHRRPDARDSCAGCTKRATGRPANPDAPRLTTAGYAEQIDSAEEPRAADRARCSRTTSTRRWRSRDESKLDPDEKAALAKVAHRGVLGGLRRRTRTARSSSWRTRSRPRWPTRTCSSSATSARTSTRSSSRSTA